MAAQMNRRIFGMRGLRLDEAGLDEVEAALVVSILRRIAYTLLALFRSVTQRSEQRRAVPWKALMNDCLFALVSSTVAELSRPQPNTC